jgi:hypothetical protein
MMPMPHTPIAILLFAAFTLVGNKAGAEAVQIPNAFVTGQKFISLSEADRVHYVMGLVDGIFLAPLYGGSESEVFALQTCLKGRNNVQIAAILLKYIRDQPENWHEGAHTLFSRRLLSLCPATKSQ